MPRRASWPGAWGRCRRCDAGELGRGTRRATERAPAGPDRPSSVHRSGAVGAQEDAEAAFQGQAMDGSKAPRLASLVRRARRRSDECGRRRASPARRRSHARRRATRAARPRHPRAAAGSPRRRPWRLGRVPPSARRAAAHGSLRRATQDLGRQIGDAPASGRRRDRLAPRRRARPPVAEVEVGHHAEEHALAGAGRAVTAQQVPGGSVRSKGPNPGRRRPSVTSMARPARRGFGGREWGSNPPRTGSQPFPDLKSGRPTGERFSSRMRRAA